MNRKQFITSFSIGALSTPLILQSATKSSPNVDLPSTESWEQIQKQFKVLKNNIYLNNGTMGITPKPVLSALEGAFDHVASTGNYSMDVESLRKRLSSIVGADSATLAITKNVTEGINIACWGLTLSAGDEVLMTKHEHVGGATSWLHRAKVDGIKIKTFDLGKTADETLLNFKRALSDKTKVVAVPHIPCTIGQILPVKEICEEAKKKDIISVIDGAHPLGMIRFNIEEIGCDYYAGCLHKWLLAPLGIGFIYIHKERLDATKIHNVGAYSVSSYDMTTIPPAMTELVPSAQRYSAGTFCGPLYKAAEKAIDWYEAIGVDRIEKRVKELSLYTQEELEKLAYEVEILSPREDRSRGAQTTFRFRNKKAQDFIGYARSSKNAFILRHVHEAKLDGVRISTHYYNDFNHIEKLMDCMKAFISK